MHMKMWCYKLDCSIIIQYYMFQVPPRIKGFYHTLEVLPLWVSPQNSCEELLSFLSQNWKEELVCLANYDARVWQNTRVSCWRQNFLEPQKKMRSFHKKYGNWTLDSAQDLMPASFYMQETFILFNLKLKTSYLIAHQGDLAADLFLIQFSEALPYLVCQKFASASIQ